MQNTDLVKVFISMFPMYLPTLLVCLVAGVVLLMKWKQASSGAIWAALGFGLLFLLCIIGPVGHTLLRGWVFQGGDQASRIWALTAFAIFSSVLHAISYVLLLVAVFAGRVAPGPGMPQPSTLSEQGAR